MTTSETDMLARQREIAAQLQVSDTFDAETEVDRRVDFLAEQLGQDGVGCLVLGMSGGVDSTTSGRMCQLAAERVRAEGGDAAFYAVRLPYGTQQDEPDAQLALDFVRPDHVLTVDVQEASDRTLASLVDAGLTFRDEGQQDFVLGNIKARQRMVAQFAIAGVHGGLVVGTDHAAEAVTGFFTKFGDGAADVTPLTGLTKRRVRAVAAALGVPHQLVDKVPTADLESLAPGKADEDVLGVSYDTVDDFLECLPVPAAAFEAIEARYVATEHKRQLPVAP